MLWNILKKILFNKTGKITWSAFALIHSTVSSKVEIVFIIFLVLFYLSYKLVPYIPYIGCIQIDCKNIYSSMCNVCDLYTVICAIRFVWYVSKFVYIHAKKRARFFIDRSKPMWFLRLDIIFWSIVPFIELTA